MLIVMLSFWQTLMLTLKSILSLEKTLNVKTVDVVSLK